MKVIFCVLVFLILLTGPLSCQRNQDARMREVKVERQTLKFTIQATGTIEPMNKVEILPPVAGRIEQILVEEGDEVKKGALLTQMSSTSRAALLDVMGGKDNAQREKWQSMYLPAPVVAPVTGRIIKKHVVEGQMVTSQSVLFELSDRLVVRAHVDETDISKIKPGLAAEFSVDAWPEIIFPAKVQKVSYQSELVNNVNIYLVELLPDPEAVKARPDALRSGMTANIDFILSLRTDVLALSMDVAGGRFDQELLALDEHGESKRIELGRSDGRYVEVLKGVSEGEVIQVPEFSLQGQSDKSTPFSRRKPKKESPATR